MVFLDSAFFGFIFEQKDLLYDYQNCYTKPATTTSSIYDWSSLYLFFHFLIFLFILSFEY